MRAMRIVPLALLLLSGTLSTACAQAEKPPPPPAFGETPPPEPPNPPPPPFGQDPADDRKAKLHHLEAEIHELESALASKEGTPEQREKWAHQLKRARANLEEARAHFKHQEKGPPKEHHERLMARLREIEGLMKKVGPENQKELAQEAEKIRAELKRGDGQHGVKMGPPMDPELHRLFGEIKELEHQTQDLGARLRKLPPENKDDRAEIQAKLKESVTKLFDLREQARAKEVEELKKRLEELTRMLEKRKANRDAIIEKRIKQLSGESDDLDW